MMHKEMTDFCFSLGQKQGPRIDTVNETFRWNGIATKEP